MAWDSKTSRRRQNSSVSSRPSQPSPSNPTIHIEPKSSHVTDPSLQAFLHPNFDPTKYLNSILPSLQTTTTASSTSSISSQSKHTTNLSTLSTETQTLLSNLSAHSTRLTTTLTQLTDEILRSGSRLAYEVEVLRGETLGLSEALTEGLRDDVVRFVPGGLEDEFATKPSTTHHRRRSSIITTPKAPQREDHPAAPSDPPYIIQLRTLTHVRSRLDSVTQTFDRAMTWTFPPSEVSVTSSFLSVSAPEPGSSQHSIEAKGQQVSKQIRDEIASLLVAEDPIDGIEVAAKRVEELRDLCIVWKGTAEERARGRFVDGLARMVEERHRELLREAEGDGRLRQRVEKLEEVEEVERKEQAGGYGFLSRLRELRGAS